MTVTVPPEPKHPCHPLRYAPTDDLSGDRHAQPTLERFMRQLSGIERGHVRPSWFAVRSVDGRVCRCASSSFEPGALRSSGVIGCILSMCSSSCPRS
jgi:hypothetical protein